MAKECSICCETVRPRQGRRFAFKVNSTPMIYINFTLSNVTIRGCASQWCQAVLRKVQELGLQNSYTNDVATHKFLTLLLSLLYMPLEHREELFIRFYRKAAGVKELISLLNYVKHTWINSAIWPPHTWCVFGQSNRTNNDVEEWHNRKKT